jgi:hypothetical protein
MAGASDVLSRAPECQEKCQQEKHQVPVKRRATWLIKGDHKGLTEDAAVLQEFINVRQSKTSLRRSVK